MSKSSGFNPRPPLLAGDALHNIFKLAKAEWFQSAPAIAGGRCKPGPKTGWSAGCFNPRPPLLAGDANSGATLGYTRAVSIRARHCWRAMPLPLVVSMRSSVFQSAPAIAGGRCLAPPHTVTSPGLFQSAPAIAGGRCIFILLPGPVPAVFQSAPAIAGGRCASNPKL